MRMKATFAIAASLLLAAPAAAQNQTALANTADATNTVDANAVTANDVGTTTTTDVNTTTATETTAVPVDSNMTETPAPEKKSFPWGVIGLVGLLGLIPRARRGS